MSSKIAGASYTGSILDINSPRNRLVGPYVVVYKDPVERFAIVALDWDGKPRLGIRWFYNDRGYPISTGGYATWLIVHNPLNVIMVKGLRDGSLIPSSRLDILEEFLFKKRAGASLISSGLFPVSDEQF